MVQATFIVSRFHEPLGFLGREPFCSSKVYVYNKGPTEPVARHAIVRTLPNVGKCDHTYLYHIVEEYDRLDELLCFLPASWENSEGLKRFRTERTLCHLREHGSAAVVAYDGGMGDRMAQCYDFQLDHYLSGFPDNRQTNGDGTMEPAPVRPFGRWYETYVGKGVPLRTDALQGVLVAHRDQVWKRNRSFYQALLEQVDHHPNPEVGHYLERSWASIVSADTFLYVDRHTLQDMPA